jgi:signal transduction histidine kinase
MCFIMLRMAKELREIAQVLLTARRSDPKKSCSSLSVEIEAGESRSNKPMVPNIRRNADPFACDEDRKVLERTSLNGAANMNLEDALSLVRDAFVVRRDIRLRIFVTGRPRRLRPDAQEQIYLISREAMVNAMRHSEATDVETEVEYLPRRLRVVIRDNGRGIDPDFVRSGEPRHCELVGGLVGGLAGMHKRAEKIGARLRVWSRLGAGTEVEISLPKEIAAGAWA